MLTRDQKEAQVKGLQNDLKTAKAVFLTNLIGMPSNDAVALRKTVREAKGKVVVLRNTLFAKASVGTPYEKLFANLKGPNAAAIAFDEAPAVAKVIFDAAKDNELLQFKGAIFDGKELARSEIEALAKLPSRDQMLGTLLATFNAPISAFARVLDQIRQKKEAGELQ